jgi:hypothetical protein
MEDKIAFRMVLWDTLSFERSKSIATRTLEIFEQETAKGKHAVQAGARQPKTKDRVSHSPRRR